MIPPALPPGPCPICQRPCLAPTVQTSEWRVDNQHTFLVYPCEVCGPVRVNPLAPDHAYLSRVGAAPVSLDALPPAVAALRDQEWP